jgi:alpha-D-ribose 1-methylphosphonate 5-triphosphate diphosphatase PhnM
MHGSLQCQSGTIRAVDQGNSATVGAIDLQGDYLIPGMWRCTPTTLSAT